MDLQGGRADTQISYINIYKKVSVPIDIGQTTGEGYDAATADAATADAEMKPAEGSS